MYINHFKESEKVWDTIADSFDKTRKKPWEQVTEFINHLPESSIIADLGCGNGRHIISNSEKFTKIIGIDISKNLLQIIQQKITEKNIKNILLIHGNNNNLPLKNDSFDAAIYIAALHNIKDRKDRIQSLKELNRTLKENGKALITVWSRWQDRFIIHFLRNLFHKKGDFGDIEIFWKQNNLNVPRFYHLYSKREFIKDIKKSGLIVEEIISIKMNSKKFPDNYFALVKKK